jgi:hypothetical protein
MGGVGARSLVCGWAAAVAGEAARPNTIRKRPAIKTPRHDAISFFPYELSVTSNSKLV